MRNVKQVSVNEIKKAGIIIMMMGAWEQKEELMRCETFLISCEQSCTSTVEYAERQ
jgi:hypothetical protein